MSTPAPPSQPAAGTIDVYTDINYGLPKQTLKVGSYPNVANAGVPDRSVTALTIPAGVTATLYSDLDFKGQKIQFVGPLNVPDIRVNKYIETVNGADVIQDWNDKLRSIVVEASNPSASAAVIVPQQTLGEKARNFWNNNMLLSLILLAVIVAAIYYMFFN